MKKSVVLIVTLLFVAMPIFSEAQSDVVQHNTLQVKSAEIFLADEGVYVNFAFFEPADPNRLTVPAKMLQIKIDSTVDNYLEVVYTRTCSSLMGCYDKPIKATLFLRQSAADLWNKMLEQAVLDYKKLRTAPVIPTYKK